MDPRAVELISQLRLQAHPEGGWYREIFRSQARVQAEGKRASRNAITAIYFLLESGRHSRWHKVQSDEVWIHLEGAPLDLWQWDASANVSSCTTLGSMNFHTDVHYQHVVPAGIWQAARPKRKPSADFTLVSCVVGPGFDFADFEMMDKSSPEATLIGRDWPELAYLI
ncbi:MAG: cupin domain-containing protein [Bdellovibrionales bacterium]|nr:cupin domain-containing protein [Ramlibacter sp.]